MAPSVTAGAHTAFPELRADRPYHQPATTAALDPNRPSRSLPEPWGWLSTSARTARDQRHCPRRDGLTNANMGVFRSVSVSPISCISSSTSKLGLKDDGNIWAVKELLVDYVKSPISTPRRRLGAGKSFAEAHSELQIACTSLRCRGVAPQPITNRSRPSPPPAC